MSARVAAVLLVLLVALGGGALIYYRQEQARQAPAAEHLGQPVVQKLQAADIATIDLRSPAGKLTLQRRDGQWTIAERAGFPADAGQVRALVLAVLELKVGQSESIGEKDRARLHLDASGTRLDFRGADGHVLATLIVGKKYFRREPVNPDAAGADGRFVLRPDAPGTVDIVADPLVLATPASATWVSKAGFGAEKVKVMEVDRPGVGKWRIERQRDDSQWKLTPLYAGEALNPIRANSASYSLNRVEIDDVAAPGLRPDETGLDRPATIVATTFDGLTYTVKVGNTHGDDYYVTVWISGGAKASGADAAARGKQLAERLPREKALAGQVLLVARAKFEDILKKRSELLEQKDAAKK
ncbi:MAG: DUF4340 domain-containing protein [Burkholderiales bacterium]